MAAAEVANAAEHAHRPNPRLDPPLSNGGSGSSDKKKARDGERRRRRRKQKKNNNANNNLPSAADADADAEDDDGSSKENADPNPRVEVSVEIEYVPEKAELEESLLEDFKNVFAKFSFKDSTAGAEDEAKKEEAEADAAKKKGDSDSEEEEEPEAKQKKEGDLSNKKKKLQRRMKIADLKKVCSRPDVVEIWDATATDPKLLVYLKSYRNSVPVPRHWCQKRKFLQATAVTFKELGLGGVCPRVP